MSWFGPRKVDVVCIGSMSQDVFFPTDEYLVIETPENITSKRQAAFEIGGKFKADDRYEAIGGVAANVSVGLSRLGLRSACYTNVGGDELGKWLLGALRTERVAVDRITRLQDSKTDLSAIVVLTKSGDRIIFHNRDANERLTVTEHAFTDTEWIFVSALNGPWKENLEAALKGAKEHGRKFGYNPGQHNLRADPEAVLAAVSQADVLVLNKDEAIELLLADKVARDTLDSERVLLESLATRGAKRIGLTDGERGGFAYENGEMFFSPIYTISGVVDSTGAGDAFSAAFLASTIRGEDIATTLASGMIDSGSVIGHYGAIAGLLTRETRDEHLDRARAQIMKVPVKQ